MTIASDLRTHIAGWSPEAVTSTVILSGAGSAVVTDVLDSGTAMLKDGDPLPMLWHWPYFSKQSGLIGLGEDGHPTEGPLYPPIPNRRRMFVGGRLEVFRALRVGWAATVTDEVVKQEVKRGRSGEMLFVTVRRSIKQNAELHQIEEQDVMYRSGDAMTAAPGTGGGADLGTDASWASRPTFSPTKLFTFSAITSNAHRIHYDAEYATTVEGYPGLVVHGPLLILSMLELLREKAGHRGVKSLSYRLHKPVICGDDVLVEGEPVGDEVRLIMRSSRHDIVASATVSLKADG